MAYASNTSPPNEGAVGGSPVLMRQGSRSNGDRTDRTNTAVVSEVFAFLHHNPSVYDIPIDEEEADSMERYANIKAAVASQAKKADSAGVETSTILRTEFGTESEGPNSFIKEIDDDGDDNSNNDLKNKDSGFASLERQILDEGANVLYESYIEDVKVQRESIYLEPEFELPRVGHFIELPQKNIYDDPDSDGYDDVQDSVSSFGNDDGGSYRSLFHKRGKTQACLKQGVEISQESNVYEAVDMPSTQEEPADSLDKVTNLDDKDSINELCASVNQCLSFSSSPKQSDSNSESAKSSPKLLCSESQSANTNSESLETQTSSQSAFNSTSKHSENENKKSSRYETITAQFAAVDTSASNPQSSDPSGPRTSQVFTINLDPGPPNTTSISSSKRDSLDRQSYIDMYSSTEMAQSFCSVGAAAGTGNFSRKSSQEDDEEEEEEDANLDSLASSSLTSCSDPLTPSSAGAVGDESYDTVSESLHSSSDTGPVQRRKKLERNPSAGLGSDDSSDEDVGIYDESLRRSHWVRLSQSGNKELLHPLQVTGQRSPSPSKRNAGSLRSQGSSRSKGSDSSEGSGSLYERTEVISPKAPPLSLHRRSDSTTSTVSEAEFKGQYILRRKCLVQRADSQQEYHRMSAQAYDIDRVVEVERSGSGDDLGLHFIDSHPAYITSVDPDSACERAGLQDGQILVSVNGQVVLDTDHCDIIGLIQNATGPLLRLGVAPSDFLPVRDHESVSRSGWMDKLGNTALVKLWKKRFFVLRQDNCLYYYKNEQETDPLGAIPLSGYTVSRHTDTNKDFCFKAEKYGARTYFFMTSSRDQLSDWVAALTEAASRSKQRKGSLLSVSSHNVSLPALDIRRPECTGFLGKLSPSHRSWRRRYCVLKDACLYYYKDVNSFSALGMAHLHGYKVDSENSPRRKHSFSLQPPEPKMRLFCFSAENETDKKRWVSAMIHSIQRWVVADTNSRTILNATW